MLKNGLGNACGNPELTALNTLPPRATFDAFATAAQAKSRARNKSAWSQSLDGEWQFRPGRRPEDAQPFAEGRPFNSKSPTTSSSVPLT